MIQFKDKKKNEIKTAFSMREEAGKVYVKFTEEGKEYTYFQSNIEVLSPQPSKQTFRVHIYDKACYNCGRKTKILTYITYLGTNEDVLFPYNFEKLLKNQYIFEHMADPSIEYYGISVVGQVEKLDKLLMENYPENVKNIYSKTLQRTYPMNVCQHCGSGQGANFVYRDINKLIKSKTDIDVL